jgi:hypothetical protein
MRRQQQHEQSDPVVAAIERVLEVEREGAERLQRSQEHARQLLTQARDQAVAIERRADARITQLHHLYLRKVQRDIEALAAANASPAENLAAGDRPAALAGAARRVAAKLTGGA